MQTAPQDHTSGEAGIIPIEGTSSPIRFIVDEHGCWNAIGVRNAGGYVQKNVQGKVRTTHRLSYAHFFGAIDGKFVLHRCDNPACCNPSHLFLGTNADNMADMKAKGRRLERRISFPADSVARVKELRNQGVSYADIAAIVGCSVRQANAICLGQSRTAAAPEVEVQPRNNGIRVTDDEIRQIFVRTRQGASRAEISRNMGIPASHISNIVNGKARKGVCRGI